MLYSNTERHALMLHCQDRVGTGDSRQARPSQEASSSSRHASPPRETVVRPSESRPYQQPQQPVPSTRWWSKRSAADKRLDQERTRRLDVFNKLYKQTHERLIVTQLRFWQEHLTFDQTWVQAGMPPAKGAETAAAKDAMLYLERLRNREVQREGLDLIRDSDRERFLIEKERKEREDMADMENFIRAATFLMSTRR